MRFITALFLILCAIFTLVTIAHSHAYLISPPVRGGLAGGKFDPLRSFDKRAPRDPHIFFPAGDKSGGRGTGVESQIKARKGKWVPFEPMSKGFRWPTSVCGDLKGGPYDHHRGGRFYYNAKVTRVYEAESKISFKASVYQHHNGHFEFHLCDLDKCGRKDIAEDCFRRGACIQLLRAKNWECDRGYSRRCGPIDRKYPGRWYLPCPNRKDGRDYDIYGNRRSMTYQLPRGFTCKRCVLHWYYGASDRCNQPGILAYFRGKDRPRRWGKCHGGGNSIGGFNPNKPGCRTPGRYSEEYFGCADVQVVWKPKDRSKTRRS